MNRVLIQPSGRDEKNDFINKKYVTWAEKEDYSDIWEDCVGDTILFVKNKFIFLVATIKEIDYDIETNKEYPLRYFFTNHQYVDIPLEELNNILKYKPNFIPRNFQLVKDIYTEDVFDLLHKYINICYDDELEDSSYQLDISKNRTQLKPYNNKPVSKKSLLEKNGKNYYPRNLLFAKQALFEANYHCMIDKKHESFISYSTKKNYVEAHHLIPLQYHEDFHFSLDVPANIVALCPNCHKMIHLGEKNDVLELLHILYEQQKEKLVESSLNITLEDLEFMYNIK